MTTARVISAEGFKATHSRIWLASLLVGMMSPLLIGLGFFLSHDQAVSNGTYTWSSYEAISFFFFAVMLGSVMVSSLVGLALTDESRFNTLKSVLTSGITRSEYLFGKLLFVALWIIAEMTALALTALSLGTALGLEGDHIDIFWSALLTETACLLALVPIFFLVALLFNNFFVVAGAGVAFSFITLLLNVFGSGRQYMGYFPGATGTAYILVQANRFGAQADIQPWAWGITLAAISIASLVATWLMMQRRDIQ
jgi:hypothetical protein